VVDGNISFVALIRTCVVLQDNDADDSHAFFFRCKQVLECLPLLPHQWLDRPPLLSHVLAVI